MALPSGPPLLPKAEAACPQWQDIQEIVKAQAPQVRWLSIWCNDQVTLARQRVGTFSQNLCRHQAGGESLIQPNGINGGGIFWPVEGFSHQEGVQILHCFVDHFSRLCFVHLQIDDSATETMLAK
jgi:hypothetical protein